MTDLLRILWIALWILIGPVLFAQSQFLPSTLDAEPEIYLLPEANQITLLIRSESETKLYVLDTDMRPIQREKWDHSAAAPDWVPLGLQQNGDHAEFVYWNPKDENFTVFELDYRSGEQSQRQLRDARTRMERAYWGTFSLKGELYMLRLSREANQIRVCRFGERDHLDQQVYTIDRVNFLADADYHFEPIDPTTPQLTLTDTYVPGKLYQLGDTLLLTLDTKGETYLVQLDLNSRTKTEKQLPYAKRGYTRGNSLMLGNALYQFFGDRDSMFLSVRESWELEKAVMVQALGNETKLVSSQGPMKQFQDGRKQSLYGISEWLAEVDWTPNLAIGMEMHQGSASMDLLMLGGVKAFVRRGVTGTIIQARYEQCQLPLPVELPDHRAAKRPATPFLASNRITRLQQQPGFRMIRWHGRTWMAYPDRDGYQLEVVR